MIEFTYIRNHNMNIEEFRDYCLGFPNASESFPFTQDILVFKVEGKMFAAIDIEKKPFRVNLKCNPDYSEELRAEFSEIIPGYHMNKKHWITVDCEQSLSSEFIKELTQHSYSQVIRSLPKYKQKEYQYFI